MVLVLTINGAQEKALAFTSTNFFFNKLMNHGEEESKIYEFEL